MPKTNRSGQTASLSSEQLDNIMAECAPKLRAALSICRFTACRIFECLALRWESVMTDSIVFPRRITKKRMATREVPTWSRLQPALIQWKAEWPAAFKRDPDKSDFVFPAQRDISKHWARPRTDEARRAICKELGLEGVSTHTAFGGAR